MKKITTTKSSHFLSPNGQGFYLCAQRLIIFQTNVSNFVSKIIYLQSEIFPNCLGPGSVHCGFNSFERAKSKSMKTYILSNCSSCEDSKCKKMKMVMSHYIQCTKLKNGQQCPLCRQLIRVISEHALYLCPNRVDGMKFPCPVPMCDIMRASAALKKNI